MGKSGARASGRPATLHEQALHAIQEGNVAQLESLLEKTKQLLCHKRDKVGRTPLMFASVAPNAVELIELFMKNNATLGARDDYRRNVLLYCCEYGGTPEAVEALMRWNEVRGRQLRWTHCNAFKQGPFILATHSLNLALMKYLIKTNSEEEPFLKSPSNDVLRALCSSPMLQGARAAKQEAVFYDILQMPEVHASLLPDTDADKEVVPDGTPQTAPQPFHTLHGFLTLVIERSFLKLIQPCLAISRRHVEEACWLHSSHQHVRKNAEVQALAVQHVRNRTWALRWEIFAPILQDRHHKQEHEDYRHISTLDALASDVLESIVRFAVGFDEKVEKERILQSIKPPQRPQQPPAKAVSATSGASAAPAAAAAAGVPPPHILPAAGVAVSATAQAPQRPALVAPVSAGVAPGGRGVPAACSNTRVPTLHVVTQAAQGPAAVPAQQTIVHGPGTVTTVRAQPHGAVPFAQPSGAPMVVSIQTVISPQAVQVVPSPYHTTTTHVIVNTAPQAMSSAPQVSGVPVQYVAAPPQGHAVYTPVAREVPPQAAGRAGPPRAVAMQVFVPQQLGVHQQPAVPVTQVAPQTHVQGPGPPVVAAAGKPVQHGWMPGDR